MGLFDAYMGADPVRDGNYNEFVLQHIMAGKYGTEPVDKCLHRVVTDVLGLDRGELNPGLSLQAEYGMDEIDLSDIIVSLGRRIIFASRKNAFYTWANGMLEICNRISNALERHSDPGESLPEITVNDILTHIKSGDPVAAAKIP